jgi:hypothetical protein
MTRIPVALSDLTTSMKILMASTPVLMVSGSSTRHLTIKNSSLHLAKTAAAVPLHHGDLTDDGVVRE